MVYRVPHQVSQKALIRGPRDMPLPLITPRYLAGTRVSEDLSGAAAVGEQNFYQDIVDAGLTSGLKFVLDAGATEAGSGQSWLDLSGDGIDWFRGTDGNASTDDPSYNGVLGDVSSNEYWSFDGGDYFTYDGSLETWMNNIHHDGKIMSFIVVGYSPLTVDGGWFATQTGTSAGCYFHSTGGNKQQINIQKAGVATLARTSDAAMTANAWHFTAHSVDDPSGADAGFLYIDGDYNQVGASDTWDSTYTSPGTGSPAGMRLGSYANATSPAASGTRLAVMAFWDGVVLSKANMDTLYAAIGPRFSLS
jgi:hypothetical protein